jgi:hypothetical protein
MNDEKKVANAIVDCHAVLLEVCLNDDLGRLDDLMIEFIGKVEQVLGLKVRDLCDELAADLMR